MNPSAPSLLVVDKTVRTFTNLIFFTLVIMMSLWSSCAHQFVKGESLAPFSP